MIDSLYACKSGKEAKEKAKELPYSRNWQREKRDELKKVMRSVLKQDKKTKEALRKSVPSNHQTQYSRQLLGHRNRWYWQKRIWSDLDGTEKRTV